MTAAPGKRERYIKGESQRERESDRDRREERQRGRDGEREREGRRGKTKHLNRSFFTLLFFLLCCPRRFFTLHFIRSASEKDDHDDALDRPAKKEMCLYLDLGQIICDNKFLGAAHAPARHTRLVLSLIYV